MSGYNTVQDGENSLLHAAVLSGDETLASWAGVGFASGALKG